MLSQLAKGFGPPVPGGYLCMKCQSDVLKQNKLDQVSNVAFNVASGKRDPKGSALAQLGQAVIWKNVDDAWGRGRRIDKSKATNRQPDEKSASLAWNPKSAKIL